MIKSRSLSKKLWGNIAVLVAFILVLIFCANTLQTIQWNNTNEMGAALVKNYSAAEEHRISTFRRSWTSAGATWSSGRPWGPTPRSCGAVCGR